MLPCPAPARCLKRRFPHRSGFVALLFVALGLVGCQSTAPSSVEPRDPAGVRVEISGRIAGIRDAILARSAAGIVAPGTADWTFTGPDGATLDRAAFVARTETLFARIVSIESLDTTVDRIAFADAATAEVEITQTMVRTERGAAGAPDTRLWLRYRERHRWVHTDAGWRVRSVAFIGTPERRPLAPGEKP
ncbi:MAG: hypothetical protein B9S34_16570 [Opitutia bacterium Tous-C1TDCM]|nr:MAG: hypothetical protein B9S34_16570 [Opitutae bacterium Tous-C1TDCM]